MTDIVAFTPIPICFAVLAILIRSESHHPFESIPLLLVLNGLFLTLLPLVVASFAFRGYLAEGHPALLMMGTGVFSLATGTLLAVVTPLVGGGSNSMVTVHNTACLLSGLFHVAGALCGLTDMDTQVDARRRRLNSNLAWVGITVFFLVFTALTLQGRMPVFFEQDHGPTFLRQLVVASSAVCFTTSAVMLLAIFVISGSRFFSWYWMGMGLIATGLVCLLAAKSVGDDEAWLGRSAQYIAGLYLLMALLSARKDLRAKGAPLLMDVTRLFYHNLELSVKERTRELAEANQRLAREMTERMRAEEAARASERELQLRNRALEIFANFSDEKAFSEILKFVLEKLESSFGTFGYFDRHDNFVLPALTREIYWEQCNIPDKEIIFSRGTFQGIWARCLEERRTLYSNDGPFKTPVGHIPITNTMVAPVIFRDEIIATIHVANKQTGYGEEDARLLEMISAQIAPVLKARLERDARERERAVAEEALRESESLFRRTFDQAPIGAAMVSLDFRFLRVNEALCRITGYSADELTSLGFPDITYPDDLGQDLQDAQRLKTGEIDHYSMDKRYIRKDGRLAWVNVSVRLMRDAQGNPQYYLPMIVDITDRKKAAELIEASLREKEVLIREIHHRVKNNLAVISSLINLQAQFAGGKSLNDVFSEMQARIRSMAVAYQMLYQTDNLAEIGAKRYLTDLVDYLAASIGRIGADIVISKEFDEIDFGLDTAIPLGLLVTELVSNALKHAFPSASRGVVKIRLRSSEVAECELVVEDDGVGIPEKIDPHSPKSLGLELVDAYVRQLGGIMEIGGSGGARFRIRFPVDRTTEEGR